jgi:hypothetical protein
MTRVLALAVRTAGREVARPRERCLTHRDFPSASLVEGETAAHPVIQRMRRSNFDPFSCADRASVAPKDLRQIGSRPRIPALRVACRQSLGCEKSRVVGAAPLRRPRRQIASLEGAQ